MRLRDGSVPVLRSWGMVLAYGTRVHAQGGARAPLLVSPPTLLLLALGIGSGLKYARADQSPAPVHAAGTWRRSLCCPRMLSSWTTQVRLFVCWSVGVTACPCGPFVVLPHVHYNTYSMHGHSCCTQHTRCG